MKNIISILLLQLMAQSICAQYQIGLVPRVSPDRSISQKIGYTDVEITYGSPSVKGRKVWGGLAAYNEVWRAGANNATTIEFSSQVLINNAKVDGGKYAFFVIPKENDKWTVILNKVSKQWGSFKYDESQDALRVDVEPNRTSLISEDLTYSISQSGFQNGAILLSWEHIEIELPFETNYLLAFEEEVELRASVVPEHTSWIVYLQGAEHLEAIKLNPDLAMTWINSAEGIMNSTSKWNEQYYPREYCIGHVYWVKAKLLANNQEFSKAINEAEKMKNLEDPVFYTRKKEAQEIDLIMKRWKK